MTQRSTTCCARPTRWACSRSRVRAQMSMLPRLKPRVFYDLVIEVAIVRPGPIQGDMVHPYLRRRDKIELVDFPKPAPEHGPPDELEDILGKTLGVPLFQEQAMKLAMEAAKFTPEEANGLRRSMATFRNMGTVGDYGVKFVEGMVRRGYDPEFARRCFKQIEGFGSYGFPESHAVSFAKLVYVSAWIKCHYPDVFCAALLNSQPMGFYQPAQLVRDAKEHGVEVREPDVMLSDWDSKLEPPRLDGEGRVGSPRPARPAPDPWAEGNLDRGAGAGPRRRRGDAGGPTSPRPTLAPHAGAARRGRRLPLARHGPARGAMAGEGVGARGEGRRSGLAAGWAGPRGNVHLPAQDAAAGARGGGLPHHRPVAEGPPLPVLPPAAHAAGGRADGAAEVDEGRRAGHWSAVWS